MADSLDALRLQRLQKLCELRLRADTIEAGVARYYDDPACPPVPPDRSRRSRS